MAYSAKKIDAYKTRETYNGLVIDPAWTQNAAGYWFDNWYGFGVVDAEEAVKQARAFKKPLGPLRDTGWLNYSGEPSAIATRNGAQVEIRVDKNIKIETVQLNFKTSHTVPTVLLITLTSPKGTKSYVQTPFSALLPTPDGFSTTLLSANNFFEESSEGTWTLQIIDLETMDKSDASTAPNVPEIKDWNLRILGS